MLEIRENDGKVRGKRKESRGKIGNSGKVRKKEESRTEREK